jgi:hypothetical protein
MRLGADASQHWEYGTDNLNYMISQFPIQESAAKKRYFPAMVENHQAIMPPNCLFIKWIRIFARIRFQED